MTNQILALLSTKYSLCELDAGDFSSLRVNGMRFSIKAYHAEGLGHVSVMRATGFFGLMKMDTVMLVPKEKDLPLYSYDRIYAMGNDTLIVELYDTLTEALDLSALDEVKSRFAHLPKRDPGEHWYDDIKLSQSISQKGKRAQSAEMDALAREHFAAYLNSPATKTADTEKKNARSHAYVRGLLEQGGPSTDVFKKALGAEKTAKLFETVLFGTENAL